MVSCDAAVLKERTKAWNLQYDIIWYDLRGTGIKDSGGWIHQSTTAPAKRKGHQNTVHLIMSAGASHSGSPHLFEQGYILQLSTLFVNLLNECPLFIIRYGFKTITLSWIWKIVKCFNCKKLSIHTARVQYVCCPCVSHFVLPKFHLKRIFKHFARSSLQNQLMV